MQTGNYEQAAQKFELLAAQGSLMALENLGCIYERGRIGPRNEEKAISYWEAAARVGSASAMHRLGWLSKDRGDLSRARSWFIESAEQGYKPSMYAAAKMLTLGQGGEIESQAGHGWLARAAQGGHAFAQRDLLQMQMKNTRSYWGRLKLYCKLIWLGFSLLPQYARNPYSENLH